MMYFRTMNFLTLKALHIVFIVTWFAGLFYMFRLFVYYAEAEAKGTPAREILQDQFMIMMKRLWYIITWPSAILASIFGFAMLFVNPSFLKMGYMHLKLAFVLLLVIYQFYGEKLLRRLISGSSPLNSQRYRILNEVPTLILIAVVFLIVLKNSIDWIWGTVGILGVAIALTLAIKWYKSFRNRGQ